MNEYIASLSTTQFFGLSMVVASLVAGLLSMCTYLYYEWRDARKAIGWDEYMDGLDALIASDKRRQEAFDLMDRAACAAAQEKQQAVKDKARILEMQRQYEMSEQYAIDLEQWDIANYDK